MRQTFYWLPRVLAILYIVFISMFALDVFEEPQWLLALLMHLIPSYILIIMTIIAWKHEKPGGLLFIAGGIFLFVFTRFESLIISIPALVIGGLFLGRRFLNEK
ncbi:hypothetical protein GYA27_04780 [candidate division WWE3 bacterium]|uniref:DUF7670 domain-containing protein n=1 Tax=candidate division WWE3 bacterium TaxID=2053526 RepID=A0A7X9HH26_UNCKA|nr:hypothetical protein [candidate division WWE3 bacterium]